MSKRLHDVKEIHLEIDDVEVFSNEDYEGLDINWNSTIGFGEYCLYRKKGTDQWCADSEYMDRNDDKEFIMELLKLFVQKLNITG